MNQTILQKTEKIAQYFKKSTNPSPVALVECIQTIMNVEWDAEKRTEFNRCDHPGYQTNRVAIETFWQLIDDINQL